MTLEERSEVEKMVAHLRFKQVDVFARRPFLGNPVAVILDGADLDDAVMQRIARWTNLSETTFVLPPRASGADYRVRIFTPRSELPFAGHPTLGTAHAVLEAGLVQPQGGLLHQECGAGILAIFVEGEGKDRRIGVETPVAKFFPVGAEMLARVSAAIGASPSTMVTPKVVDVGPRWLTLELADDSSVRSLAPDMAALTELSRAIPINGLTVFGRARNADHAFAVRSFVPAEGVPEDPVCGSGNAAVGALLHAAGALPKEPFVVSQGREVERDGYVTVRVDPSSRRIWIAGHTVTCIDGVLQS